MKLLLAVLAVPLMWIALIAVWMLVWKVLKPVTRHPVGYWAVSALGGIVGMIPVALIVLGFGLIPFDSLDRSSPYAAVLAGCLVGIGMGSGFKGDRRIGVTERQWHRVLESGPLPADQLAKMRNLLEQEAAAQNRRLLPETERLLQAQEREAAQRATLI